jgi:hypothetical protein
MEETKKQADKGEIVLSEKDKAMLINTINKKGFFLEEKAYGILEQRPGLPEFKILMRNFLPKNYNLEFKEDRIEIDLVFVENNKNLIIECKKTDFAWIFPRSLVGLNKANYMVEYEDGMRVMSFDESNLKVCYSEPMEIMMNDNGTLVPDNKKEFVKTQSRQEDPIQRAVMRVLHQTKAWRWEPESRKSISFFIPVILTNAPLLFLDYNSKQIDRDSNIVDYNYLEEVGVIVYNYPEFLDWPSAKDETQIKSVFIVNINHFTEFLDWILSQSLSTLAGLIKLAK